MINSNDAQAARAGRGGAGRRLLAACLLLAGALPGLAAADSNLLAAHAWVRETPPGVDVAAAYLTVHNEGRKALRLTGVSSPLARTVTLHESMTGGGMSRMRLLASIPLPAGGDIVFQPGGRHIMLQGLAHPLHAGDRVPLALRFADGTTLSATALVVALDANPDTGPGAH